MYDENYCAECGKENPVTQTDNDGTVLAVGYECSGGEHNYCSMKCYKKSGCE